MTRLGRSSSKCWSSSARTSSWTIVFSTNGVSWPFFTISSLALHVVEGGDAAGREALHLVGQVDAGVDDAERLEGALGPPGPVHGRVEAHGVEAAGEGGAVEGRDLDRPGEGQAGLLLDVGPDRLDDLAPVDCAAEVAFLAVVGVVAGRRGGRRGALHGGRRGGGAGRGRGLRRGRSWWSSTARAPRRDLAVLALVLVVLEQAGDGLPGVAEPVVAQADEVAVGGLLGDDDRRWRSAGRRWPGRGRAP